MKSTIRRFRVGFTVVTLLALACSVPLFSQVARAEKDFSAVDAEEYADFMENEAYDLEDLTEGAEIQRLMFNCMTPPGINLLQPMFPSVVPFFPENFTDSNLLEGLLGLEENSVAIYPLSLVLDPKTRETLVYNVEGELIAVVPAEKASDVWPEGADPARVTLLLDLMPSEDVELYLYVDSRIAETLSATKVRTSRDSGASAKSLGTGEFGICSIQKLTNGNVRVTVTNGDAVAETFTYTVLHSASNVVSSNGTFTLWTPLSPSFNGIESDWVSGTTNLVLTNGVGVWEDTNISSNDRVRFYAAIGYGDYDGDGLTDGGEILQNRTETTQIDTDGDGLLDGYDIVVYIGDSRYEGWAGAGIVYTGSSGMRTFKGELTAGSNPLEDDTDGDSLPDGWEVQNDLDPLDDGDIDLDNGLSGDPDGDGFDNELEYELGAPANNAAWNGSELAYQLMHATPVVVTNARSVATNFIGMRVTVEDSWDCVTGGNTGVQNETDVMAVPALLECGYYVDIEIDGLVEDVDLNYDKVYFEAFTNNLYFMSHDGIPDGEEEYCLMVGEGDEKNNLIFANSSAVLRYDTVGYRWHSGGYAEITSATNTGPYKVVISGDDALCVGETISMGATGAAGAPYTWNGSGGISVSTNGDVTGLSPGIASVTATDAEGCSGEKEIVVLKPDIGTVVPLADRTLHPNAARKPLVLMQTLPPIWNGQMQLSLTGAVAYSTPTGGTPIASGFFTNSQLSQTVYLEGDGCGTGEASFTIVGPPGCETNVPLQVFGVNATLDGVAEVDEESPGGFIADHSAHTNAPRTLLTLEACGPASAVGTVDLTWNSSLVEIYSSSTGGMALAQFSEPFAGFSTTNLYVQGIAPGTNLLEWSYSEQADCADEILVTIFKVNLEVDGVSDNDEETIGAFVPVNADNDNGSTLTNLIPSCRDFDVYPISAENDLVIGLMTIEPSSPLTGTLRLKKIESGRSEIKIWDSPTKNTEIVLPKEWSIGTAPSNLYIEGVREGTAKGEISLGLDYIILNAVVCSDTCKVSVTPILNDLSAGHTINFNPTYLSGSLQLAGAVDLLVEVDANGVGEFSNLWLVQHGNTDNYLSGGAGAIPPSGNAVKLDFNAPYTGNSLVDIVTGDSTFPFYSSDDDSSSVRFESSDDPAVNLGPLVSLFPGQSSMIDLGYSFDIFAAWQNEDASVYFLGYSSWSIRMQGTFTNQSGTVVFQAGPSNITTSSSGFTRDNTDRNLSPPDANSELEWLEP